MAVRRRTTALAGFLLPFALVLGACTPPDGPTGNDAAAPPTDADAFDESEQQAGGTLRFGLSVDPVTIDPRFVADDEGELIVGALFDPLVRLDEDLRPIPAAAAAWENDDEGRVFTFQLRSARFHDGTPVTAEDFRRTFAGIADGTAEQRSFLSYLLAPVDGFDEAQAGGELRGVEAVDAHTLVIRLDEPSPGFIGTLSNPSLVPVPPAADADPDGFALQPIGNGPFRMTEPREPGSFLRLSRYEEHHRPAALDEVVFQVYPTDQGLNHQWDDLLSGQLQVAEIPPGRRERAVELFGESDDGYTGPGLLDGITSAGYLYGFDTTTPPFDDPRVRRAISMAIDREALAEDVLQGARIPASAIVPPPIPGAQPGPCGHCRHDPIAAAELFEEAMAAADVEPEGETEANPQADPADALTGEGTTEEDVRADTGASPGEPATGTVTPQGTAAEEPTEDADATVADEPANGQGLSGDDESDAPLLESLTLTHNRGATHTAIAERMATDIGSALGIEVEFRARGLQTFVQTVRRGEASFFRLGWDGDSPDPGAFLYPLFHSSQIGRDNLMGYANDEVDALLEAARANPDRSLALDQYREAERLILEDAAALPLLFYRHATVVAPEVQGLHYSPLGRISFSSVRLEAIPSG